MNDWQLVTALCTAATALGTILGAIWHRAYAHGHKDTDINRRVSSVETLAAACIAKIEILATQLDGVRLTDATSTAELKTMISAIASAHNQSEMRIAKALEDLTGRIDRMLERHN